MNEYNVRVNFEKGLILTNLKKLVQNDYNSTKLNFTFDKEGRVLFKLLYPDGTQYVDEIQNNELIFGKGVLNQEGTYEYEISLYTDDGRLTDHATKSFEVRSELVNTDELVAPDDRVPVLDNLINEVTTIKQDVEDGKYNGKDGTDGQDGATPTIGENGNWFVDGIDTGMPSQGPQGEKGESGGVSLKEVKAITGELDNLNTEDKSNLVNAINEVASNSGGSSVPLYTITISNATLEAVDGITSLKAEAVAELDVIVKDACEKGYGFFMMYAYFENQNYEVLFTNGYGNDLLDKPSFISIYGEGTATRYIKTRTLRKYSHQLRIDMTWSDDVPTVTSGHLYGNFYNLLPTTNEASYTPISDYNPATKKYVDDLVGDISTVLSTLTTVSEVSE